MGNRKKELKRKLMVLDWYLVILIVTVIISFLTFYI